ncbi:MAG: poly-A polymerase [Leptospira sp.]|nr:poly-A polymerase [Leptospira sp.]
MPLDLAHLIPEIHLGHLKFIHNTIVNSGHECYLVGGSVRDLYMNQIPHEYDLTTNARPEIIKSLFKSVIDTGIKHGTVTVLLEKVPYEITTYRIDKDYTDGRHPDVVEFGNDIKEDLKRRDFTMNALALNIETGELIDEHDGKKDIDQKIIRTIGDPIQRFTEDGLRPIRAMRFASVLGFQIEKNTKDAIHSTKHITAKISVERLQDEILKSLRGPKPSVMVELLSEEKTLSLFLKEDLTMYPHNPDELNRLDQFPKEIFGFLIGQWAYAFNPTLLPNKWQVHLQKLKFSNVILKDAEFLLERIHWAKKTPLPISDYTLRKEFLAPLKKHIQQRKIAIEAVWKAVDLYFWPFLEQAKSNWENSPPLLLSDLEIDGKIIEKNFPTYPKPKYGELLHSLLEMVLEVPDKNNFRHLYEHCVQIVNKL